MVKAVCYRWVPRDYPEGLRLLNEDNLETKEPGKSDFYLNTVKRGKWSPDEAGAKS